MISRDYYGDTFAEKAMYQMSGKIKRIYAEASRDIEEKIKAYNEQFERENKEFVEKVKAGEKTWKQYGKWKSNEVYKGKRWNQVLQDVQRQINKSNETASRIVNDERKAVFIDNVNYSQYTIDKDYNFGLSFTLYDSATVTQLIRDDPELLPTFGIDEQKCDDYTRKQIASAVTQSVIQGETIDETASRIGKKLGSTNENAMIRIARTAMTSAQNAGRIEAMHNAQDMGINVEKVWIATLDRRTRDAHAGLDGQTKPVDEPFESSLGNIMFPADPNADPANVWNCRCTLGWDYPKYRNQYDTRFARTENGEGEEVEYMTYKEWASTKAIKLETPYNFGEKAVPYSERGIELDEKYSKVLAKLKKPSQYIVDDKDAYKIDDLAILTTETGVEFTIFSTKDKTYLMRGDELSSTIPYKLIDLLKREKGTIDAHSHPFIGDLVPSVSDINMLNEFTWQEESVIIEPSGRGVYYSINGITRDYKQLTEYDENYFDDIF